MAHVIINSRKCIEIAEHIRISGGVPEDREDPMPYSFPLPIAHNAWCAVVAICHQTTPVVGTALSGSVNGVILRGWDYLLQKSIVEANRDPALFTVEWLCAATAQTLMCLYRDTEGLDTLNYPEERAMLLADLGDFLDKHDWQSIHQAYLASDGYIIKSDGFGIAQVLTQIKAYRDPVQKKLFFLLALMRNQGFWQYHDIVNLSSPVNYHEQRGHMRLGTVTIIDPELERKIRAKENISDQDDIEIRFAVRRVIEFIAQLLDLTPSMMHYYFWNYFRNCCSRNEPHCSHCGPSCKLPDRYKTVQDQCIFAPVCTSAGLPASTMYIEPRLDSTLWQ